MSFKRDEHYYLFNTSISSFSKVEARVLYHNRYRSELGIEVPKFEVPQLKKIISGSGFVYLYSRERQEAYKLKFKSFREDNVLLLEGDLSNSRVEKRSEERFSPRDEIIIELSHGTQSLKKECYDISPSGFSLFLNASESTWLDIDFIPKVQVLLGNLSGRMKVENVGHIKIQAYANDHAPFAKYRVSFKVIKKDEQVHKILEKIFK